MICHINLGLMNLYLTKTFAVADWNSMGRVIAQPRARAFQRLGRAFQTLGRAFSFRAL